MKSKKILLVIMFIIFMSNTIFAYSFELLKYFTQEQFENEDPEIQWYDENNYPYAVEYAEEDEDGNYISELEYYNCNDDDDLLEKGNKIIEKNRKNGNSYNNGYEKESIGSTKNNNSSKNDNVKIDPNVFYGKKKEECPTEEILLKMQYYMQPALIKNPNDFNSGSQYHYIEGKTAYFYPVVTDTSYISFISLIQDSFNELGNTILIVDFCQFVCDSNGKWVLKNDGKFADDNEKNIFIENYEKVISDAKMLFELMGCKKYSTKPINGETPDYQWYICGTVDANSSEIPISKSFQINKTKMMREYGYISSYSKQFAEYSFQLDNFVNNIYLKMPYDIDASTLQLNRNQFQTYLDRLHTLNNTIIMSFGLLNKNNQIMYSEINHDVNIAAHIVDAYQKMYTFLR